MQEAAFTELINKQSLEQLMMLENENQYHLLKRDRFDPDEVIIKFRQKKSEDGTRPQSQFVFPQNHYPRGFNFNKSSASPDKSSSPPVCVITGQPARYKDPITGQPYATLDAFKILREKFFQKEEERLFVRIQVLADMLQMKKDRLRRVQS